MQADGNLVAYPTNSAGLSVDAYWASDTYQDSKKGLSLYFNHQGFLFMDTVSKKPVLLARSSYPCNNKTTIFRATLDADGIFRLYSHCLENKTSRSVHIEWSALNNQCNVHGFCDFNSYCSSMGTNFDCSCYPGFAFNDPNEKKNNCGLSCLEDCLCDVALYKNERCEKYTAPIRYGSDDIPAPPAIAPFRSTA
ncbi:hypothetical protein D5086_032839 [Populus alba]|uniref:Uncharacterized protein n=1 Tax=Populus alba TaxID=43335 RepID=A0ACC4AF55_POPAL